MRVDGTGRAWDVNVRRTGPHVNTANLNWRRRRRAPHNRRMTTVRLATLDEIPDLAAVLARAFAHDPFFAWMAGDAPERSQRMRDGWSGILRHGSAHLAHTYTTDDLAGVAIWLPPEHHGTSVVDSLRQLPALARLTGWRRLRQIGDAMDTLEQHRHRHAPQPHFYLSALGVEPERQGEGLGTALVQPVLDRCDRDRIPAYLETAVARNVLLYERLGFGVVEELDLPGTDIHGWLMLRPLGVPSQLAIRPAMADPSVLVPIPLAPDRGTRGCTPFEPIRWLANLLASAADYTRTTPFPLAGDPREGPAALSRREREGRPQRRGGFRQRGFGCVACRRAQ